MRGGIRVLVLSAAVHGTVLFATHASAQCQFVDRTDAAGIQESHGAFYQVECPVFAQVMHGGASCGDFDGDGWEDVFFATGGHVPDRLFINQRDGTFVDDAQAWGVAVEHVGVGVAVGDYDRDGNLDAFVVSLGPECNIGPGHHKLYKNTGTSFVDVAAGAGVATTSPTEADGWGAAFGDYDLDGFLDLGVPGWIGQSDGNRLFHNEQDGTFSDATAALNFDLHDVRGLSVRFTDMNGDRYPEILWVSDFGESKYFVNRKDGTFLEATAAAGVGLDSNGMGQTVADFDRDGKLDWYVTSIQGVDPQYTGNMMYRNLGDHVYEEASVPMGVKDGGWGWGTSAADFDLDGWVDVVETNGWYLPEWVHEQSYLFHNLGGGHFEEIADPSGLQHHEDGRALLTFDYDEDGDQDVLIVSNRGGLYLFRNERLEQTGNWLRLRFDTGSKAGLAPHGFGTRVTASIGRSRQVTYLDGGSNYLGQSELAVHFGLGNADVVDKLVIQWADGNVLVLHDVPANQTLTVAPGGK